MNCNHPGCDRTIEDHKWARIKDGSDWFFEKATEEHDERAWCPDHHPEWVKGWREKKRDGPLRNKDGSIINCMHTGCNRPAVRIVAYERPDHKQFKGQTHDCCAFHSRG